MPHKPSAQLMRDCPDIVLEKAAASALGFKVFRTGKQCPRHHKGFRYVSTGACLPCAGIEAAASPRRAAVDAGLSWYVQAKPCGKCGIKALKHVHSGRCKGCELDADSHPRDVAVAHGLQWYKPLTRCYRCKTTASRMVKTGKCSCGLR